ncbi:MAG: ComEC/Rec2 family competence protein [Spirochaetales bacterium]|nr:ComEC/Rec2 family competence protein [Spirochaetales bacterium]
MNNLSTCKKIFSPTLELEKITKVYGRLISDTRKGPNYKIIQISTNQIESNNSIASTTGIVTILFKDEDYLYKSSNIVATGKLIDKGLFLAEKIEFLDYASRIQGFRATIRDKIFRILETKSSGGILAALFLGDRNLLSPGITELFRKAGCMHILALSGMHIGFIAAITGFICAKFLKKRAALLTTLAVEVCYCFLVNSSPSVTRALLMSTLGIYNLLTHSNWSGKRVLGLSFLIQATIQPIQVTSIGFLLSYAAVAGIIVFNSFFQKKLKWIIHNNSISSAIAVSLSAITCTIPFMIFIAPEYNLGGIFASIILTFPIMSLIILSPISIFSHEIIPQVEFIIDTLIKLVEKLCISILEATASCNFLILRGEKIIIFYLLLFSLLFCSYLVKILYIHKIQRLTNDKF